jgi:hypothetical protein
MHGLFPHIHCSHPVCHFSCDHGRYQFLGNAVASLLLHSHSEVAYWTVCGNFVQSGWLILSQKAIPHKTCSCTVAISQTTDWETWRWPLIPSVGIRKNFQSFAVICRNRMWLAQFVCVPQFFKTPSRLCGHTVYCWVSLYFVCDEWDLKIIM